MIIFRFGLTFQVNGRRQTKKEQEEVNESCRERERGRERERENQTKFSERMGPNHLLSPRAHGLTNDQ
jgi:hypothetical protein